MNPTSHVLSPPTLVKLACGCVLQPSAVTARMASLPSVSERTVSTRTERNMPSDRSARSLSSIRARSNGSPRFTSKRRRMTH